MAFFGGGITDINLDGALSVPAIPVLPVASVSITPGSANEGNSGTNTRTVTVTLDAPAPAGGASVAWAVTGVGANPVSAADFQGGVFPSGTITIAAGLTTGTGTITIVGDTTVETDETGRVTISSPSGCTLGVSAVDFTIVNDDVSSLAYTLTVEDNGWVLAVRGPWGATPGAWNNSGFDRTNGQFLSGGVDQFPLDASGTPKVVLSVQDAGFDRIGGLPVANANRPRTVVATKPLRKAWGADGNGLTDATKLDEFDHGDGTRTVRLALSDRIYATSTVVSVSFLSGWKAGEGGGVINIVTNSSTRTVPLPIFRWANEPWPYVGGTEGSPVHLARVELIIASHHPEHFGIELHQACAAVKLTAYDGTTSKDFFFTGAQTSPLYGDSLRCWGGTIDLSGLSAGPITVHATVYPWVGEPRSTGTAHSTDINAALATVWGGPFHLWYDPESTVWPRKYVAVDPVNGTTTNTAVVLHDTPAAAEAAASSTKPRTISLAQAGFNVGIGGNQTLPARNGFSSVSICAAWWEIIIPEGVSVHDTTSSTSGTKSGPGYVVIRSISTSSDPRTNCILRSGTTSPANFAGIARIRLQNIRVESGQAAIFTAPLSNRWLIMDNVTQVGKAGSESSSSSVLSGAEFVTVLNSTQRNCDGQQFGQLMRNVTRTAMMGTSNRIGAVINTRLVMPAPGEFAPARTTAFNNGVGNVDDLMVWNSAVYGVTGSILFANVPNFGGVGAQRWALVNSVFEADGNNRELLVIGETAGSNLRGAIFEGCVFTGGRFNFHNDCELHGTSAGSAVRVNNSPNTTIILGVFNHGLSNGDTITVAGAANANVNRATPVAVTVLDANRFSYTAGAAVTSPTSGVVVVTVVTGARAGDTITVLRQDMRQVDNVIRNCAFDRNATKHDTFAAASYLTGSWELLYGVGYSGNAHGNRGTSSPFDFQYAFYGINSDVENALTAGITGSPAYRTNWFGYVDDETQNGPQGPSAVFGGDYRASTATVAPYEPSRLLSRGTVPAVIDEDANGNTRGTTYDSGALGRL